MPNTAVKKLAIALYAIDLLLLTGYVVGALLVVPNPHVFRLINLDAEASLGAWASASQLLLTGTVFAVAAGFRKNHSVGPLFLTACALAFFFLSADEAAAIHEKLTMIAKGVEFLPRFSGDHGVWIPIYMTAGGLFVVLTHKSWLNLWRDNRAGTTVFLIGIALFVLGAVALEILSYGGLRDISNREYYLYQVFFEEAFELVGVTTILIGAIRMCFDSPWKQETNRT